MSDEAPTRMEAFKVQARRALLIFVVADLVFVVLGLVLYFQVFQPRYDAVATARDHALRTGIALEARARAVEARYALTVMDFGAARLAVGDVRARLIGLAERVPADRATEAAEVKQLVDRAALLEQALEIDPASARQDLELLEAKLAALYPPPSTAATAAPR